MPRIDKLIIEALDDAGAVLIRQTTHAIFRLPNGHNVVVSKTPSDWRTTKNKLAEIRQRAALPAHRNKP